MRKLFNLFTVLPLIFIMNTINAQVQEAWVRTFAASATSEDRVGALYVDNSGNSYVSGRTTNGITTIKYDKDGNQVWVRNFSGFEVHAITVDGSGNVYVAGGTGNHFLILKYTASGTLAWSAQYTLNDEEASANAIAVDPDGNVYVTGFSNSGHDEDHDPKQYADYATIKYSPGGTQLWVRRYNGADPGLGFDAAVAIAVDAFGNSYVTGTSQLNGQLDIATIKYNTAGTVQWIQRYDGPNGEQDKAGDIKMDAAGNIIVVGTSQDESPPSFDVYRRAVVVKYTFSGFELWEKRIFGDSGSGHHVALDVEIDASDNILIGGYSEISEPGTQFVAKYDPSGNQQWLRQSIGVSGRRSEIATDGVNVYTVGYGSDGIATIKFNASGSQKWRKNYETGAADNDSRMIGVDGNANVYMASDYKPEQFGNSDYLLIKYTQCELTCPADITVNAETGQCGKTVNYPDATTAGDCGTTLTYSKASGTSFPIGTTQVTVTSTETGATCSFNVTVNDAELPVITNCPQSRTVNVDPGVCYATASSVNAGTATASDNCSYEVVGIRSDGLALTANYPVGNTTITWTATDASNNTTTCLQTIIVVDNVPPTITGESASTYVLSPPNHTMRDVTVNYTATDNCTVTSVITVNSNEPINGVGDGDTDPDWVVTDNHHVKLRAERSASGTGRIYTITITATDPSGNTAMKTIEVRVPHDIKNPHSGQPFKVGSTVAFEGEFWDKAGNSHSAKWLIDDNISVKGIVTEPVANKNGKVTGSYKFTAPGVYKLQMNTIDQNNITSYVNTNGDLEAIIVIYDPNGGNTYGGGYFNSPAGALKSNPSATGKASYGFAMNYFKNSTYPKGETQFDFKVGSFEFNALNFEYLVISNSMSQFKGTGKITGGQSGVGFTMTVVDGQLDGSGVDKIRMKIYNKNNGSLIYDNQPGASDAALPAQAVATNSTIVISGTNSSLTQSNTTQKAEMETTAPEVPGELDVIAYPNPSANNFSISVKANSAKEKITMQVVDMYGRIIETRNVNANSPIRFGDRYNPGTYFVRILQGKEHKEIKLIKLSD